MASSMIEEAESVVEALDAGNDDAASDDAANDSIPNDDASAENSRPASSSSSSPSASLSSLEKSTTLNFKRMLSKLNKYFREVPSRSRRRWKSLRHKNDAHNRVGGGDGSRDGENGGGGDEGGTDEGCVNVLRDDPNSNPDPAINTGDKSSPVLNAEPHWPSDIDERTSSMDYTDSLCYRLFLAVEDGTESEPCRSLRVTHLVDAGRPTDNANENGENSDDTWKRLARVDKVPISYVPRRQTGAFEPVVSDDVQLTTFEIHFIFDSKVFVTFLDHAGRHRALTVELSKGRYRLGAVELPADSSAHGPNDSRRLFFAHALEGGSTTAWAFESVEWPKHYLAVVAGVRNPNREVVGLKRMNRLEDVFTNGKMRFSLFAT